jgi:hypothetical protein
MPDHKERREDYLMLGEMKAHIETLVEEVPKIREDVGELNKNVAKLQVKATIGGGVSGLVATLPLWVKYYLSKGGGH